MLTCSNHPNRHVLALTKTNTLTSLLRTTNTPGNTHYTRLIYPCTNGQCIPLDKTCDLVDDCGDGSDEVACENGFQCDPGSQIRVPLTALCDGVVDCPGHQDECGCDDDAGAVAMVTMGATQVVIAITVLFFVAHPLESTYVLGWLLMGLHLVVLSVAHFQHLTDPCLQDHPWRCTDVFCWYLSSCHSTGKTMTLLSCVTLSLLPKKITQRVVKGLGISIVLVSVIVSGVFFLVHDSLVDRVFISNTAELHRPLSNGEIRQVGIWSGKVDP
eukprot:sb/3468153/